MLSTWRKDVTTMDKNIKAELSSLKTEIINGLNGIEKLILSLDSKFENTQSTTSSSLYDAVDKFWPDMNRIHSDPRRNHDLMKDIIDKLRNVDTVLHEQEANELIDDIKRRAGMLDGNISKLPTEHYNEITPVMYPPLNTGNIAELMSSDVNIDEIPEIVENNKKWKIPSTVELEGMADKMQQESIPETFNYPADYDNKVGGPKPEKVFNPEWLTDVDKKSMSDILKQAAKWDDDSQAMFVQGWNNDFKKRYDIIKSKLDTFLLIVKSHTRPFAEVKSIEDAKRVVKEFESFENLRMKVITLINQNLGSKLYPLLDYDKDDKFVLYYNYLNELSDNIRALELDAIDNINFIRVLNGQYGRLLVDHELDMYELTLIDPKTFEPIIAPADKQTAYKNMQYMMYKKYLSDAYKHLNPVKKSVLETN